MNGDGFADLSTHFRVAEAHIAPGDAEVCLSGETFGGIPFEGCDAVATVPPRGARSRGRH